MLSSLRNVTNRKLKSMQLMGMTTQGHHKTINLLRPRLMGTNLYKGKRQTYFNFIVLLGASWASQDIMKIIINFIALRKPKHIL